MRPLIAILAVAALAAIATVATTARPGSGALSMFASPTPRVWAWPAAAPTERAARSHPQLLSGFMIPIGGTDIPGDELYLPNSPRDYRAGYPRGHRLPGHGGHARPRGEGRHDRAHR